MRARSPRRNPRSASARRGRTSPRRRRAHVGHEHARLRALHAIALMRRDERSLRRAAARVGTTPRTVRKYARQALRKRRRTYQVIPIDELRRPMRVLTERGLVVLDLRSSKAASRLATYWNAVDEYLRTGDRRGLVAFDGRGFRAEGQLVAFITDPHLLDRLANAGQVTFEDLYESSV